jgi:hypothetical protein
MLVDAHMYILLCALCISFLFVGAKIMLITLDIYGMVNAIYAIYMYAESSSSNQMIL